MENILKELKDFVQERGFTQEDKRLGRTTKSLPGHLTVLSDADFASLKEEKPLEKFNEDWKRMYPSFRAAVKAALEDKDSRRLVVFNDSRFNKVFQCFTHVQFVYTHRNEFDLYAYLRSSDLAKLKDDCVFFASLAKKFEAKTKIPVTKLVIVFGHIHFQIGGEHHAETTA